MCVVVRGEKKKKKPITRTELRKAPCQGELANHVIQNHQKKNMHNTPTHKTGMRYDRKKHMRQKPVKLENHKIPFSA